MWQDFWCICKKFLCPTPHHALSPHTHSTLVHHTYHTHHTPTYRTPTHCTLTHTTQHHTHAPHTPHTHTPPSHSPHTHHTHTRLELWPGFITSILQYETNVMLCADISHKILRTDTVYDYLNDLFQTSRNFHDQAEKTLVGEIVLTR